MNKKLFMIQQQQHFSLIKKDNIKDEDIEIKKGDAIGQGIFQKYFVSDNDLAEGERVGGFGSTNK